MKKIILLSMMLIFTTCILAFAEASFDDIQGLIKAKNYSAAEKGLEGIIQNHPKSAKAYYAMSQAQAGLGNQVKAKEALDMATGLDPKLKFASSGTVENLKEAITPQTQKIEAVESHTMRNCLLIVLFGSIAYGVWYFFIRKEEKIESTSKRWSGPPCDNDTPLPKKEYHVNDRAYEKKTYTTVVPRYGHTPTTVTPASPVPTYNQPAQVAAPIIVNHGNGDLMTGVLLGSMLNNHGSSHDTYVEREVIREVPVEHHASHSRNNDNDDSSSKSDDSWEDKSSSSSSSSWDSGSSSSDSSSSWD